jgi:hypothetical protein
VKTKNQTTPPKPKTPENQKPKQTNKEKRNQEKVFYKSFLIALKDCTKLSGS